MEAASIRYKNPGAMWGNALAIKWGAASKAVALNDGKGQGNNIAVFPTFVQGICAQLDLWRTSRNYRNKRFADAIAIWSGHNEVPSYIAFCKKRVPGLTENTIMNDAFWNGPSGIAFLKAQAWHEAGKPYPAADADWIEAQRRVFSAVPPAATATAKTTADAAKLSAGGLVTGAAIKGAQDGWPLWVWLAIVGATLALCVVGYFGFRWWRNRKAAPADDVYGVSPAMPALDALRAEHALPTAAAVWADPPIAATRPKRKPARKKTAVKAKKKKAA